MSKVFYITLQHNWKTHPLSNTQFQHTKIHKDMSAFIIFLIVVTIGYVLYYAAIITIDLNAKSKSSDNKDLSIDTDGLVEQSNDYKESDEGSDDDQASVPIEEQEDLSAVSQSVSIESEQPGEYEDMPPYPTSEAIIPEDIYSDSIEEDNPYGLTDEEDQKESIHPVIESQNTDINDTDENDANPSEDINLPETAVPVVQVFEPEPSDLASTLNTKGEPITVESTMPVRPEMMAMTLLKARKLIKEDIMNEDNGISYETDVFDKI